MEQAGRLDRKTVWKEMSVVLTNDAGIRILNQKHLGNSDVTDVISFNYDPLPGERGGTSGEIIVNVERAAQDVNRRWTWDAGKELALYIAHGCDHLVGQTDSDDAGRARMRRRELRWINKAARLGLIQGVIA